VAGRWTTSATVWSHRDHNAITPRCPNSRNPCWGHSPTVRHELLEFKRARGDQQRQARYRPPHRNPGSTTGVWHLEPADDHGPQTPVHTSPGSAEAARGDASPAAQAAGHGASGPEAPAGIFPTAARPASAVAAGNRVSDPQPSARHVPAGHGAARHRAAVAVPPITIPPVRVFPAPPPPPGPVPSVPLPTVAIPTPRPPPPVTVPAPVGAATGLVSVPVSLLG
jgi:hypothetical protein